MKKLAKILVTICLIFSSLFSNAAVTRAETNGYGDGHNNGSLFTSSDANNWQIVSGEYLGCNPENKDLSADGRFRVQKNVIPTDKENEFLVYLSIDACDIFEKTVAESYVLATTSNNLHDKDLGTVVNKMTGNKNVHVSETGGSDFPNSTVFTIIDDKGNVLVENKVLYWSQAQNTTLFLDLKNGKYIVLGVEIKAGQNETVVHLDQEATTRYYELINSIQKISVTDPMGIKDSSSGIKQGEYIKFLNVVYADDRNSYTDKDEMYDSANNLIAWSPSLNIDSKTATETTEKQVDGQTVIETKVWHLNVSQLVYRVRLMTENDGFVSSADKVIGGIKSSIGNPEAYAVNNHAKLYEGEVEIAQFNDPYVRGVLYDAPTIVKVDPEGNELSGAEFTMTRTEALPGESDILVYDSVNSDSSSAFSSIPEGTYSITETKAPNGYTKNDSIPSVTFNYTNNPSAYTASGANMKPKDEVNFPNGFMTVVDTKDPEATIDIKVSKIWNDMQNEYRNRPDSVTVQLFANDSEVDGKTLKLSGGVWESSFTDLPVFDNELNEIVYSVKELDVNGNPIEEGGKYSDVYNSVSYEVSGNEVSTTNKMSTVTVSGTKNWNDSAYANVSGYQRPESINIIITGSYGNKSETFETVNVTAEGSTADGSWTWQSGPLPEYVGNEKVTYSVAEGALGGYSPEYGANYTVTNTPVKTETTNPTSITVKKVEKGTSVLLNGAEFELTDPDGNKSSFTAANGTYDVSFAKEGSYKIKETEAPEGYQLKNTEYTVSVTKSAPVITSGENGWVWTYNLTASVNSSDFSSETNTLIVENESKLITIPVTKVWDDFNDESKLRPGSVTIRLYENGGTESIQTMGITDRNTTPVAGQWTNSFVDLPEYKNGVKVNYTISEDTVEGYSSSISGNMSGFTVTNSHMPLTDLVVKKVWKDSHNNDDKRPDSVTVQLVKNNVQVEGKTLVLSGTEDEWTDSFTDLEKYDQSGNPINYTVSELNLGTNYVSEVSVSNNVATVTNTHDPETIIISGQKTWNDETFSTITGYSRPSGITVNLYAGNDTEPCRTANVVPDNNGDWKYEFSGLSKYSNKSEISYHVEEVVNGYTASVTGYDISNTPKVDETKKYTSVTFTIRKLDAGTGNALKGAGFTVDGEEYMVGNDGTVEVTISKPGTYTVSETTVPTGYTKADDITLTVEESLSRIDLVGDKWTYTYALNITNGVTNNELVIRNASRLIDIPVTKTWNDNFDQDGKRPDSVTVKLLKNGEPVEGKTLELSEELNSWEDSFTGLTQYEDGSAVNYSVVEVIEGNDYSTEYSGNMTDGFVIKNTHLPDKVSLTVEKIWIDDENKDKKRPSEIYVTLLADGEPVDEATVTEEDEWIVVFSDLDVYKAGEKIEYTIIEDEVESYLTGIEESEEGFIITNVYVKKSDDNPPHDRGGHDGPPWYHVPNTSVK